MATTKNHENKHNSKMCVSNKQHTEQHEQNKRGYNYSDILRDLFRKTSQFRVVLKTDSIRWSIYLCLATILLCARSVIWSFVLATYHDGVKYQIMISVYMIPKGTVYTNVCFI